MAVLRICITKDDIITTLIGNHYEITLQNGMVLNFTPDAMAELKQDVSAIEQLELSKINSQPKESI